MLCECLLWPRTHSIKEMLPERDEDDDDDDEESYDVCSNLQQMISFHTGELDSGWLCNNFISSPDKSEVAPQSR